MQLTTKIKACVICNACEKIDFIDNVPEKPETFTTYPSPTEDNDKRVIHLCPNCKDIIKNVCIEVIKNYKDGNDKQKN